MVFIKNNVNTHELKMHMHVNELNIVDCPKLLSYNFVKKELTMKKIEGMSVSDMYGEESDKVPDKIFNKIRKIIKKLYDNNIIYNDITGYNFMLSEDKIYIIDFEHAQLRSDKQIDKFVLDFINGLNKWNPEFR
jgi:tRNA A-37 threonylcarbamoyl transferase component Bud32